MKKPERIMKGIPRRRKWLRLILIFFLFGLLGLDVRLTTKYYSVQTEKIKSAVRIGLVTDLHSCYYGAEQQDLIREIEDSKPDVVLLGGDIIDDDLPKDNAEIFMRQISTRYPTYYVTGNHEYRTGQVGKIKKLIKELGVTVLDGKVVTLSVRGEKVDLLGIDDPKVGAKEWKRQFEVVQQSVRTEVFSVLLTHRPELFEQYLAGRFDLTLAGHAHGGQWRIPGLLNGLIAPNQGLFPKYAGGMYEKEDRVMVVSRGLARESTRVPRLFNRPEYVIVDLLPIEGEGLFYK